MKKKVLSIITIILLLSTISLVNAASEDEISASIELGLPWLAAAQNPDGSWGGYEYVAHTGLAVLKFIDRAVETGEDPFDPSYEYSSQVIDGLDYLFLNAYTMTIGVQPAGDPDSDGDTLGVYFESPLDGWHRTYSTGISLMAIATAAKVDGSRTVSGGPLNTWSYSDVVQDIVDYVAYGQNDAGNERGGWGYYENHDGWSDNSNAGWMTLGLGYGANAGANVPQFVYDELNVWVAYIQSTDGGSGYTAPNNWENTLKTGNLLYQMALVGDTADTPRVEDAVAYLDAHWSDADQDPGWRGSGGDMNYQAAYCIMKGLESLGIETIGPADIDWFDELSTRIVETQHADGHWSGDLYGGDILATTWALLTLEKTVAIPVIEVGVDIKPGSWPNPLLKGSKGVISVAICGTEDFDVMTVDPVTVKLYIEGIEDGVSPLRWSWEDVATPYDDTTPDEPDGHEETADGYIDLVLKYDTPEVVETLDLCELEDWEYVKLFIRGNLIEEEGGIPIEGSDWVRIQSPGDELLPSFLKGTRISVYEDEYTLPVGEKYYVSHGFLKDGWSELSKEEQRAYIEEHWFVLYIDGEPVELITRHKYYKNAEGYQDSMLLLFYIQYKPNSFDPGTYVFSGEWHFLGDPPFEQSVTVNFFE